MDDKILITSIKKEIFELCNFLWAEHLQVEGESQWHIFHAIKIIKNGELYSLIDVSKDYPKGKSVEISNKFLLIKIKEELELLMSKVKKEVEEEIETEAMAEMLDASGEPIPETIMEVETILKENILLSEEEVIVDLINKEEAM